MPKEGSHVRLQQEVTVCQSVSSCIDNKSMQCYWTSALLPQIMVALCYTA